MERKAERPSMAALEERKADPQEVLMACSAASGFLAGFMVCRFLAWYLVGM